MDILPEDFEALLAGRSFLIVSERDRRFTIGERLELRGVEPIDGAVSGPLSVVVRSVARGGFLPGGVAVIGVAR